MNNPVKPVPTVGDPRYSDDGATGGQDVRFHDAGISAMVVGRTVFLWGADLVHSSADFALVEGERVAFDTVMVRNHRAETPGETLGSMDQMYAPLKLQYPAGSTATLTMHSRAGNPQMPNREIRSWTFRVR